MRTQELKEKLTSLSTTHFCDATSSLRIFDIAIQRLSGPSYWVGKAFTVHAEGDVFSVIEAIDSAREGDVLVIAAGTHRAIVGEILSTAALKKGIAGIVIDGYCRDLEAIQKLSIPLYAKGIYPGVGKKEKSGQLNCSIFCGNILIAPNDIIFGDDSGLIAMSEAEFKELLPIATKIKNQEIKTLELLEQGNPLSNIYKLSKTSPNKEK